MMLKRVTSSNIVAVGYSYENEELVVEFPLRKDERQIYIYAYVSPELARTIITSESIGSAFAMYIRNATIAHPFRKPTTPLEKASYPIADDPNAVIDWYDELMK